MATLFVRHDVSDFAHWKQAYDDFDARRQSMGVTGAGVYQEDGNPNNVTVYHHFDSIEAAKAFAASTELRETMEKAGVAGEPTIWFANSAS
jgi:quinol monooxygenase YgiN